MRRNILALDSLLRHTIGRCSKCRSSFYVDLLWPSTRKSVSSRNFSNQRIQCLQWDLFDIHTLNLTHQGQSRQRLMAKSWVLKLTWMSRCSLFFTSQVNSIKNCYKQQFFLIWFNFFHLFVQMLQIFKLKLQRVIRIFRRQTIVTWSTVVFSYRELLTTTTGLLIFFSRN